MRHGLPGRTWEGAKRKIRHVDRVEKAWRKGVRDGGKETDGQYGITAYCSYGHGSSHALFGKVRKSSRSRRSPYTPKNHRRPDRSLLPCGGECLCSDQRLFWLKGKLSGQQGHKLSLSDLVLFPACSAFLRGIKSFWDFRRSIVYRKGRSDLWLKPVSASDRDRALLVCHFLFPASAPVARVKGGDKKAVEEAVSNFTGRSFALFLGDQEHLSRTAFF